MVELNWLNRKGNETREWNLVRIEKLGIKYLIGYKNMKNWTDSFCASGYL